MVDAGDDEDLVSLEASSMSDVSDGDAGQQGEVNSSTAAAAAQAFGFTPGDHELLVRVVKLAQKMKYSTAGGTWAQYIALNSTVHPVPKDPKKHPWNTLADFVEGLTEPVAREAVQKMVSLERRSQEEEELRSSELGDSSIASPEGSIWSLVQRTMAHPRFADLYRFPSFDAGWLRIRQKMEYDTEPRLLAIDCEMCATATDDKALLSLCMVDTEGTAIIHFNEGLGEKVQEMVKPEDAVTDFRTAITGHTAADLEGIEYSRGSAQQDLLRQLVGQVVLVGHALHHDLRALRLDYLPVIDTSLLLSYKDLPEGTPALTDLVQRLLGRQLRQPGAPHDVAADAHACLDLALYEHQKGPTPPLDPPASAVTESDRKRLLVHSLPVGFRDVDVIFLFPPGCPPIAEVQRESKAATKAVVGFGTEADARATFAMLPGRLKPDSLGRAQKLVKVPSGQFKDTVVRVRVLHFGSVDGEAGPDANAHLPAGTKRKLAALEQLQEPSWL